VSKRRSAGQDCQLVKAGALSRGPSIYMSSRLIPLMHALDPGRLHHRLTQPDAGDRGQAQRRRRDRATSGDDFDAPKTPTYQKTPIIGRMDGG